MKKIKINRLIDILLDAYDVTNWWPHNSLFEIAVGAILIQQTNWKNVEKVLINLEQSHCIDAPSLAIIPNEELEMYVRPCGFFRQKAKTLKSLASMLTNNYSGDIACLFSLGKNKTEKMLRKIRGIGEETCSAILLYAGNYPIFIQDAYAKRIIERIGIDESDFSNFLDSPSRLDKLSVEKYKGAHAAIVMHCQKKCKKKYPECKECELLTWCNYGQISNK